MCKRCELKAEAHKVTELLSVRTQQFQVELDAGDGEAVMICEKKIHELTDRLLNILRQANETEADHGPTMGEVDEAFLKRLLN